MDVWAAANVTRVPASGWAEDTQVFEVVPGRRVMIVPASGWLPQTDCPDWIPIGAAKHLPVNTYKCDYPEEVGEVMLDVWWSDYSDAVKAAFGVVECEHRGPQNFGPSSANKRKHYVTVGNSDLAPDDLHADGCPTDKSHRGEAMWAPDCESATDECRQHITVLAYPHNTWALDWGGHTEWAARQCGDPEDINQKLGAATPAALRVAPLGDRTVVFQGGLLHRATHPEKHAGIAQRGTDREGLRFSTVMQLVCRGPRGPGVA